jgi:hypothetical protein
MKNNEEKKKVLANNVTMLQIVPKKRRGGNNAKPSSTRIAFLRVFEESFGNITYTCQTVGISRLTFYRWMKSESRVNRKFQEKINLINASERQNDFIEGSLMQLIRKGDAPSTIFAAKTRLRNRGYAEKVYDLEFALVVRAVQRLENVIQAQIKRNPDWKPNLDEFVELAAKDFGVKAEDVHKEFVKRSKMKALEFLIWLRDEIGVIRHSKEGNKLDLPSNGELRRYLKNQCVFCNEVILTGESVVTFPIRSLVLFPNSKKSKCTIV